MSERSIVFPFCGTLFSLYGYMVGSSIGGKACAGLSPGQPPNQSAININNFHCAAGHLSRTSPALAVVSYSSGYCPSWAVPYSNGSCPCWALPYSSATHNAAGLRLAVVPHDLGQCVPRGVQSRRLPQLNHLPKLGSQLLNLRSFVPHVTRIIARTCWTLWYQTSNASSVFVRSKSGCPDRPAV